MEIRQEDNADHLAVFEVNQLAFGREHEGNLVALLRQSDAFVPELSLVALLDGKIVGHILFTKISIVKDDGSKIESLALAPMAVRPEFQNKGIGGSLIQHGLNKARTLHYTSVIVLGHSRYYPRFGFVPAAKWNIQSPFNVPSTAFMALELREGSLENAGGKVVYPKEFDSV